VSLNKIVVIIVLASDETSLFAQAERSHSPICRFLFTSTVHSGKVVPFQLSDIGEGIRDVIVKEWYIAIPLVHLFGSSDDALWNLI